MDSPVKYRTDGSSALDPSLEGHPLQTPIIDFYRYANTHVSSNKFFSQKNKSLKKKALSYLKNDELFQDFWLPERPKTRLADDNVTVFLVSAILFVPMAIGVMAFF